MRRFSKTIRVGNVLLGGDSPISVQSMTNTPASDYIGTLSQIRYLEENGCEIIRMAIPRIEDAVIFSMAKNNGCKTPLVADIHFDYRIALEAVKQGADKIRINPGNIGASWKIAEVASACKNAGLPIRIGVNGGSLDKRILKKYGSPTPDALAESALSQAEILEQFGFSDIIISIKSSKVQSMLEACRIVAKNSDYPLHLGVTEAGDAYSGLVKNAIGIGSLLQEGIGDTIRVSLTADPVDEIRAGREILRALQMDHRGGIDIISCPTCGRTCIDLIGLQKKCRDKLQTLNTHGKLLRVAIMGCVVNGPGEAREADYGIAGGDSEGLLFKKGEIIRKVPEESLIDALMTEIQKDLDD